MLNRTEVLDFSEFQKNSSDNNGINSYKKTVGWFCTYTPEEIILASGFKPFRISGNQKSNKSEGYFPINFCPFVKSAFEEIMNTTDCFSGLIFTNGCDGMRRFYDICKKYIKNIPCFLLDVPRIKNMDSVNHFKNNMMSMAGFLESIGGNRVNEYILSDSIEILAKKRFLLKKLNNYFKFFQKSLGLKNYFNILNDSFTIEPEVFNMQLNSYINDILNKEFSLNNLSKKNTGNNISSHPETSAKIMIVGNFLNEEKLWEIFEELDCIIAAEDMCNSTRYFENIVDSRQLFNHVIDNNGKQHAELLNNIENDNDNYKYNNDYKFNDNVFNKLLSDIATRQLFKPQCIRMANLDKKIEEIKKQVKKNKIDGIIFISQKFCDNTLIFYPLLRRELQKINKQSLFLEIEHNNISSGQLKTRIQAFLEII